MVGAGAGAAPGNDGPPGLVKLTVGVAVGFPPPSGIVGAATGTAPGALGAPGLVKLTVGVTVGLTAVKGIVGAAAGIAPGGFGAPAVGTGGAVLGPTVAVGAVGAPAKGAFEVFNGIVGAGAAGGPLGATDGTAGRPVCANGTDADGTAGASAAFKDTRTVSFFKGTLVVCFDGFGCKDSCSLIRAWGF